MVIVDIAVRHTMPSISSFGLNPWLAPSLYNTCKHYHTIHMLCMLLPRSQPCGGTLDRSLYESCRSLVETLLWVFGPGDSLVTYLNIVSNSITLVLSHLFRPTNSCNRTRGVRTNTTTVCQPAKILEYLLTRNI